MCQWFGTEAMHMFQICVIACTHTSVIMLHSALCCLAEVVLIMFALKPCSVLSCGSSFDHVAFCSVLSCGSSFANGKMFVWICKQVSAKLTWGGGGGGGGGGQCGV